MEKKINLKFYINKNSYIYQILIILYANLIDVLFIYFFYNFLLAYICQFFNHMQEKVEM